MIIETKNSGSDMVVDDHSILAIRKHGSSTCLFLYGGTEMVIETDYDKMKELFIESKKRDRFTDELPRKLTVKKFPIVHSGEHSFEIQIQKTEHENEVSQQLRIIANFPVKNDIIKTSVENIAGVESYNEYGFNKYEGSIYVGKLFDIETVREDVEKKVIECIE